MARNCRQGTRYLEASGRQTALRTATVSPDSETVQQAGNGSDVSSKASRWMHGVCHASQGGDPPEQNTFQPLRLGPTSKIPVIVEGYCGTQLSIGAEITVTLRAGEYEAKDVVLV